MYISKKSNQVLNRMEEKPHFKSHQAKKTIPLAFHIVQLLLPEMQGR
jgi:hypothetical protein